MAGLCFSLRRLRGAKHGRNRAVQASAEAREVCLVQDEARIYLRGYPVNLAGGRTRPMRNKKIPSTLEAEKGWDV